MNLNDRIWNAVVVRPQVTWFARVGAPQPQSRPTIDWALEDLARLVHHAATRWFAREGTIVVQPLAGDGYLKAVLRQLHQDAKADGWTASERGDETGWYTMNHPDPGRALVHLGVGPLIRQSRTSAFNLADPADIAAARLAEYERLTGAAWRGTAGMSGCAAIRAFQEKKKGAPLWRWDTAPPAIIGSSFELRGGTANRVPTAADLERKYVHHFDVRGMYLAAANTAEVGWSAPRSEGPQEFDPRRSGYWKVRRDQLPADAVRYAVKEGDSATLWTTTPVMVWLAELGIRPEVMDSVVSERTGRYLKPWAEKLTAALYDPTARTDTLGAVKDTYARTVGMLGRPGGRIYRPDWRDHVIDRARVNLLRKVRRAGVDPLRYNVDSIWVATDETAEELGARLGAYQNDPMRWDLGIGKMRHESTMTPAEYVERYERALGR